MRDHPADVCRCGDYRRQHWGVRNNCRHHLCHCTGFVLFRRAPLMRWTRSVLVRLSDAG